MTRSLVPKVDICISIYMYIDICICMYIYMYMHIQYAGQVYIQNIGSEVCI